MPLREHSPLQLIEQTKSFASMNERNQRPSGAPTITQLLWHCLMGITLGIICVGLLLQIAGSHPGNLIEGPDTLFARLRFLVEVTFLFGIGATLTGATFLMNEKSRSKSG
jgi:hypothetical protein